MIEFLLPALLPALTFTGLAIWRWRWLRLPVVRAEGRVTLILPVTGPQPGLPALLACLGAQTLLPRRLVVVIESASDPALARSTPWLPLPGGGGAGRRCPLARPEEHQHHCRHSQGGCRG
ncbi:hypothetical protein ACFQU2_20480 [Siccirubricoccus deserti]